MDLKAWMIEIRAPFLLLPVILSFVGGLLAFYNGSFDALNFIIFLAILLLLHITVNTLNEVHDDRTGIDYKTNRTMFNGGTGILQSGRLAPEQVIRMAVGCFVLAAFMSILLIARVGVFLIPVVALGMVFAIFYTQIFARNLMGEVAAGMGLGFLPVLGAYMVHDPSIPLNLLVMAVASGILTFNLLLLNEFPDVEADVVGGRKNIVIALGRRRAAGIFSVLTFSIYLILVCLVLTSMIPPLCLLGLATIPFAFKAASISFTDPRKIDIFVTGLKANVQVVLITQILFAAGIAISYFWW